MALRDVRVFDRSWDLVVERDGDRQKVTVLSDGNTVMTDSSLTCRVASLAVELF